MKGKNYIFIGLSTFLFIVAAGYAVAYSQPGSCTYYGGVSTSVGCGHTITVGEGEYVANASASVEVYNVVGNVRTEGTLCIDNAGCSYFSFYGNGSASPSVGGGGEGDGYAVLSYNVTTTHPSETEAAGGGTSFSINLDAGGQPVGASSGGACDNDGNQENDEQCDGNDFNGRTCTSLGFNEGTLNCHSNCTYNTNDCRSLSRTCGNGLAEASEQCDGSDFRGNSCQSIGYRGGTLNCLSNCTWNTSACTIDGESGSGGPSQSGSGDPNLQMQVCLSGVYPPCTNEISATVGQVAQLVSWYSDNGGSSWVDKTSQSDWSLHNNKGNNNTQETFDYDYNSSCAVGYCYTARGLLFDPPDNLDSPAPNPGRFKTIVANSQDCANGSGCPAINANYSGTDDATTIRISSTPPPPPPPEFDYSLSNSGNSTVAKSNGNAYTQNTITTTLTLGTTKIISLSASGVPSGVSYSFSSGCSPTCSMTITFTVPPSVLTGTYPITITGNPLNKTTTFDLVITGNPISVTCTATPSTGITLGETVTLSVSASGGNSPYSYQWYGTSIPTNPVPTTTPYAITYSTIGPKTARALVTDNSSQQAECPNVSIFVNFDPKFEEF